MRKYGTREENWSNQNQYSIQTAQTCSNSKVPEGAGLSMAQLNYLTAVNPLRANEAICYHSVALGTISSFAI